MRKDLASALKAAGKRGDFVLAPIRPRMASEKTLARFIARILAAGYREKASILEAARRSASSLKHDDTGLEGAFGAMRGVFGIMLEAGLEWLAQFFRDEEQHNERRWTRVTYEAVGERISMLAPTDDVEEVVNLATQRAVSLIRGLTDDTAKKVEGVIIDAMLRGKNDRELAALLERQFRFARRRAQLIARDQTAKFNSVLNQIRQRQAGITQYQWWTQHDERVRGNPDGLYPRARPSHWARHGMKFRWASPPVDGHPGEPIMCRCIARPVLTIK